MLFNILTLILEILYCYILLSNMANINKFKNKVILFFGIGFSIMISGAILQGSIFRYLLLPIMFFILIKFIDNNIKISSCFIITLFLFYKFLVELLTVILLYKVISFNSIICIFESLLIISAIVFSKKIKFLNNKILALWNGIKKFYVRYLFLIVYNSFILFTIYNLIKIKEVM